jgi:hypothetical protein
MTGMGSYAVTGDNPEGDSNAVQEVTAQKCWILTTYLEYQSLLYFKLSYLFLKLHICLPCAQIAC